MTKIYSPKQFSYLFSYSDEDIATQLGITSHTIVSWRNKGLTPIDNHRPTLYHGFNVKETLGKMNNKKKFKLALDEFYCLGCKDIKRPFRSQISVGGEDGQARTMAICPDCHKRMIKVLNWDQFYQIQNLYHVVDLSQLYDSICSHSKVLNTNNQEGDKKCLL